VALVFGASRHEQKITDAPSSVTIVTRQDIQERGDRTLADVLNNVRGLYVTNDRGYHYLGIRGVNRLGDFGGRTLVNINGHRTNDPLYDSSFIGHDLPLNVDLIDRVEVIRGPSSSLYGNNAFFGIINIVTRRGADVDGVEMAGTVGEWGTHAERLSYGDKFDNGLELLLSASRFASDGNPRLEYPAAAATGFSGAVERDHDRETAHNFFASVSYHGLTLEGLYGRRDKQLPNAAYFAVFNDPRNELWDERGYVEARYERALADDWRLLGRCYLDHYVYGGAYVLDYAGDGNLTVNRDEAVARWAAAELQLTKMLWNTHRMIFGFEGRRDLEQHQANFDVDPAITYIDTSKSLHSFGLYGQGGFDFGKNVTLSMGVRYDYFSTFGSTINPRTALIARPWTSGTLKAIYGQAYRAPNAYEFDFDNATYKGNHALKPETIRSYELVWEETLARNYRLTSTLFYNQVGDLITQGINADPEDARQIFSNTDSVTTRGGELEVEGQWRQGWRARASYAFAQAIDDNSDEVLDNSPRHVATLQVTAPLFGQRLFAALGVVATSHRGTGQGDRIPGRAIVNLTLFSRKVAKGLELSAGLRNVFNRKYYDAAPPDFAQDLIPQDGRTFQAKLSHRF
jgi:iron complex outermembrane receptor protein